MDIKKYSVAFVTAVVLTLGTAYAEGDLVAASRTISVRGSAEVAFPADHVVVVTSVVEEGNDAKLVQAEARRGAARVLDFIRSFGVESEDLSTNRVSLSEVTDYFDDEDHSKTEIIPEYEAIIGIRFILRDLERYDELMNGIMDSGVNRILGLYFDSTARIERAKEARKAAIRAAREKAEYLADELGQVVGDPIRITEIVETSYFDRSLATSNSYVVSSMNSAGSGKSSINPEEQSVSAIIEVIFELSR